MNHFLDYSKYDLDTLYGMLTNLDKKEHPDRVQEIVKRIKNLECESSGSNNHKRNVKRLKYALLGKDERDILSQDPFACFRIVSWTYRDIFIGIGIILVFYSIGKILSLYQHFGIKFHTIFLLGLIAGLLHDAALFSYPYFVCRKRKIWPLFPSMSLSKLMMEILRSVGLFFLISLSIGLIIKLVGILTNLPIKSPEVWKWTEYAPINQYFIFFLFLSFAIIPIVEEIFFRGFLYNSLKKYGVKSSSVSKQWYLINNKDATPNFLKLCLSMRRKRGDFGSAAAVTRAVSAGRSSRRFEQASRFPSPG